MMVDLGSVGKGYTAEVLAKLMKEKGVTFHDIDTAQLQALYKKEAAAEGFTFDPVWQQAVDQAIETAKSM